MRRSKRWTLLAVSAGALLLEAPSGPPPEALFSDFRYEGSDDADRLPLPAGHYRNPVLAGFRPDPAITRVGRDFFMITSSFGYWPGLPIFQSRDLVTWRQVGAAISRPEQMDLSGQYPSDGLYGPDLKHHRGVFYALSTCLGCGGNFVVTARNVRGPWSKPTWLRFDGIDPSIFFDDDGRAYVLNNGPPPGPPRWSGHRAIWMQEIDLPTLRMIGPRMVIVDGGVDPATKPSWIEGPHLFRRGKWFYLIAAEGGTGDGHSEVAFRARSLKGPYEPAPFNPILTQRDLPADRKLAVSATGHADMIELSDGSWWAVFLGTRPYSPGLYNTGRDTFLLPVTWRNGWPRILDRGAAVPRVVRRPRLPAASSTGQSLTGAFSFSDRFATSILAPGWTFLRAPRSNWWRSGGGRLALRLRPEPLGAMGEPSLVMVRQAHAQARAEVTLRLQTAATGAQAGLVAFQDERRFLAAALTRDAAGGFELRLQRRLNKDEPTQGVTIATVPLAGAADAVRLRLTINGPTYRFAFSNASGPWRQLGPGLDGRPLSTRDAGGFTGTMLGMFAYAPDRR